MEDEEPQTLRAELTPAQRTADMRLTIDPGFVHHRKIQTLIGEAGMTFVDEVIEQLPDLPEWMRSTRVDHIYM